LAALGTPLRRHRVLTHLTVSALALAAAVALAIPAAPVIQASLTTVPRTGSILPANVGVGVPATGSVVLDFPGPMDRAAVSAGLGLVPRTTFSLLWSADSRSVALVPDTRWATDERYVIHLSAGTAMADGGVLGADWRAAFTTQTAPRVIGLLVGGVPGSARADTPITVQEGMASTGSAEAGIGSAADDAISDASAAAAIGLTFSAAMDAAVTEAAFLITPAVAGTFTWEGTRLWFAPTERFAAGARYTITLVGARDTDGNPLGGDPSFSFTTRAGAEAASVTPASGEVGVIAGNVTMSFSQPMNRPGTEAAFALTDSASGQQVAGTFGWSADARSLTFTAGGALASGRTYVASLGSSARDADGNPVTISWQFTTAGAAAIPRPFTPVPAAQASGDAIQYALNQVNAARASYGFAPLSLNDGITAVAYGHAADMLANGYFSHDSLDGTTYRQRLTAGGISYGYSGENQCYLTNGGGVHATLDWCHAAFWAEPYPGDANHKANILNPNFREVGIGIAVGGGKVIVVWDFTD
jgi:uncharacterized protein YkwD